METIRSNVERTRPGYFRRMSWGAVFAGMVVAVVIQILLSLLGLGIGFTSFSPTTAENPLAGFGMGTMIWSILTMIISLFAGGWVAGWISSSANKTDRMIHGLITWSVFSIFSLYLVTTSVGSIIGGAGSVLGKGLSSAGGLIEKAAPGASELLGDNISNNMGIDKSDLENLKQEAMTILRQTGKSDLQPENLKAKTENVAEDAKQKGAEAAENPATADQNAQSLINKLTDMKEDVMSDVDRDALANVVAERTGKSKEESMQIVNNWADTAEEAKRKIREWSDKATEEAKKVGEDVSDAMGKVAFFGFFSLLLGAGAAIGGSLSGGNRKPGADAEYTSTTTVSNY